MVMNGFYKMKERLEQEGWYVGWGEPCCQSCAWSCLPLEFEEPHPHAGKEVDLDKVLFNHEQDCEDYDATNKIYDELDDLEEQFEYNIITISQYEELASQLYDKLEVDEDAVLSPEQQTESLFCFSGSKEGVKNLKEVLYILDETGCSYNWSGTADQRIEIWW
jgi:hypothetical protein